MIENKIIDVDITHIPECQAVKYGADLEKWQALLNLLKVKKYISLEVETEESYYDSVVIVFSAKRRETDAEVARRKESEEQMRVAEQTHEKELYEKLKKKYGA